MRVSPLELALAVGRVHTSVLTAAESPAARRVDGSGDSLPDAAVARFDSARFRRELYS
jgi:hypothetical protein